jgi:hypothetical protein
MNVAVITANYGNYDQVQPVPRQSTNVDEWILVTDDPETDVPGWKVVYEPRHHVHPNIAAKIPKFRPDLYSSADYTIWVDASTTLERNFVDHSLLCMNAASGWAMFPHPDRTSIIEEVKASRGLSKYNDQALELQVEQYLKSGYPDEHLWATGAIVRDSGNATFNSSFGDAWLAEVIRWSFQDQLSFAFLAWRFGLLIGSLGAKQWDDPRISFGSHL